MNDEPTFQSELKDLINKWSKENGSNTPDFILAEYLNDCLIAFDKARSALENDYYLIRKAQPVTSKKQPHD